MPIASSGALTASAHSASLMAPPEQQRHIKGIVELLIAQKMVPVAPPLDLVPIQAGQFRGEHGIQVIVGVTADRGVVRLHSDVVANILLFPYQIGFRFAAMIEPGQLTTTVSTKGQVILPKEVRRRLRWRAGTRLMVENTREGVLLKPLPVFNETKPEEIFGSLAFEGTPKSLEEMEAGVLKEARRSHESR